MSLFPTQVRWVVAEVPSDDTDDPRLRFPGIVEPPSVASAVAKRRREFFAGRHCARRALGELAAELADSQIAIGRDREPLWPPGIVGAITHTDGIAGAAVAWQRDLRGVGVDVEALIALDRARRVASKVATPRELAELIPGSELDEASALTLVFSAKESLYKCLRPIAGIYFDFQDAELTTIAPARGAFTIRLDRSLPGGLDAGLALEGRFEIDGRHLFTSLTLP